MWSDSHVTRPLLATALLASAAFLAAFLVNPLPAQQPLPARKPPPDQQPAPGGAAKPPLQAQSASGFTYSTTKDGQKVIDIRNVRYGVSSEGVPGLPPEQRLLLRVSTRNRQVLDEIGVRATVQLEAWPLGADPKTKPLYGTTITGTDAEIANGAVWVVSRGLEETEWWTVLKLATTQRLFDTYVPLVHFSISRETLTERYAGLEVPPDDTRDVRLREPHVVGVLEYASEDALMHEALLTCDDTERARLLRSYADVTRTLTGALEGLTLTFSQNYPSPPAPVTVTVPVANDDLDLAHAKLPAGLHLAAFKR
jgi:hypothetical protein